MTATVSPVSVPTSQALPFDRVLVALDASDHAERALAEAVRLAGTVTGIHAYAARLHDRRFRQMEGGLPERYRAEDEMERQRDVHDSLITRGLGIISDSYHDVAARTCSEAGLDYRPLSPEGKNYRRIVEAAESGDFDMLAMGALGLGAVPGSPVGTVCERVVRRSPIDVLVVRDPGVAIGEGPVVVGIDGSARSFGALKTAFAVARRTGAAVHAVAAYDPYYHYVAFNKIAGVLSDEVGKVFRFKEQEKLHEELIDDGIAKIYASHLEVAARIAEADGVELVHALLDGKPFAAIAAYLEKVGASLLLLGKTGVHADAGLDIGGTAENLLRGAPCHVWIGQTTYTPPLDVVAEETIAWTDEAEERLRRVPETARPMVRIAILRLAQESGHTMVTSGLIDEATERFCPERGGAMEAAAPQWSAEAEAVIATVADPTVAASLRRRAEKTARRAETTRVGAEHVRTLLRAEQAAPMWSAAALARLARERVADADGVRAGIEGLARDAGTGQVTAEMVEAWLAPEGEADPGSSAAEARGCPFAAAHADAADDDAPAWTAAAERRLERVPDGFMRAMTRRRIEAFARRHGAPLVDEALIEEKYAEWAAGSARRDMTLDWDQAARRRIAAIPDFVRGMVVLEVERRARAMGRDRVGVDVIDAAGARWESSGAFHSPPGGE